MHYWVKSLDLGRFWNTPWRNIKTHELTTLLDFCMSLPLRWYCFIVRGEICPWSYFTPWSPQLLLSNVKMNSSISISMYCTIAIIYFSKSVFYSWGVLYNNYRTYKVRRHSLFLLLPVTWTAPRPLHQPADCSSVCSRECPPEGARRQPRVAFLARRFGSAEPTAYVTHSASVSLLVCILLVCILLVCVTTRMCHYP